MVFREYIFSFPVEARKLHVWLRNLTIFGPSFPSTFLILIAVEQTMKISSLFDLGGGGGGGAGGVGEGGVEG